MTNKSMMTVSEVEALIVSGTNLFLAGSESALGQLPKGSWIGGTIPYFMTEDGGMITQDLIQVVLVPSEAKIKIESYTEESVEKIPQNYFENGFSLIVIPAFSSVHQKYAKDCSTWKGIFNQPLVGWITGLDLNDKAASPKVIDGRSCEFKQDVALVMHVELPPGIHAVANIINIFKQGEGDSLTFPKAGFEVDEVLVNGKKASFSRYISENEIDLKLPLVADYLGAMINVSLREVSKEEGKVKLYAPVFPGVTYRFACPVGNYEAEFSKALKTHAVDRPLFACNCILNFLYANLEGKKLGNLTSAMTFGEIAYMLLNQTMVYLSLEKNENKKP